MQNRYLLGALCLITCEFTLAEANAQEPQPPGPATQPAPQPAAPGTQPYAAPVTQAYPQQAAQPAPPQIIVLQQAPMPPEPPPSRAWADPRMGFKLSLGGPNGQFGGGFAWQPYRLIEVAAWASYAHASASGATSDATADADIKIVTGMARAQLWPLERHSVVIDGGLGFSNYSMSANGVGLFDSTESLHYKRSGTPGLANIGVGYGYRSNAEFRISIILGAIVHTNKLPAGTVTSTGSFTAADRENLRAEVDASADKLTDVRAYGEVSVGFLF